MKLCRYIMNQTPTLGVLHDQLVYEADLLYELLGEPAPQPVLAADVRTIAAAPEVVTVFLQQAFEHARLPRTADGARVFTPDELPPMLPVIANPEKIVCVGMNYRDHCEEQRKPVPTTPVLFGKFANALAGHDATVALPALSTEVDYEGELALVIGRSGRHIPRANALAHVFGYTIMNDISARDLQRGDGQWLRAKSIDGFAPVGPFLATADEVPDPQNLAIQTRLNGDLLQDSNTANMIFPVAEIIEFISSAMTLTPGDLITTGTPAGVGVWRNPQRLLAPRDRVEITIAGLGTLRTRLA